MGMLSTTPGRVFQEAACRRMVMIDDSRPEIREYFEDGKEIVTFDDKNADDLRQKVLYYLEHESEREAIAHNGCVRTMRDNTWKRRIFDLLRFASEQV
jgi:spore maturation protein CgeB